MSEMLEKPKLNKKVFFFQNRIDQIIWFIVLIVLFYLLQKSIFPDDKYYSILLGSLMGMIPSFIMSIPYTLIINSNLNFYSSKINEILTKSGFVLSEQTNSREHWIHHYPRWLRWESNEVFIHKNTNKIIVNGPAIMIWKFRKKLY